MDQVELIFAPEALDATASKALERETGARGLRAIIEGALLDVMYEIPSRPEIRRVVVDRDVIEGIAGPRLLDGEGRPLGGRGEEDLPEAA
jgi:ATP-dependent Clp protease ATP-binding subunit ClpX